MVCRSPESNSGPPRTRLRKSRPEPIRSGYPSQPESRPNMQQRKTPWWRPDIYARRRPNLLVRQRILHAMRGWFMARDLVEAEPPALQVSPGLEQHMKAFATILEMPPCTTPPLVLPTRSDDRR